MGGVYSYVFKNKGSGNNRKAVIIGLDAAGKTTLLYKLKLDEVIKAIPTIGFNVETLKTSDDFSVTLWDVGGGDKLRPLFVHYIEPGTVIIFVVDSTDCDRMTEAFDFLKLLLRNENSRESPVLILANKQDLEDEAMTSEAVREHFQVDTALATLNTRGPSGRPIGVIGTSAITGQGLKEALKWIQQPDGWFYDEKSRFWIQRKVVVVDASRVPEQ